MRPTMEMRASADNVMLKATGKALTQCSDGLKGVIMQEERVG